MEQEHGAVRRCSRGTALYFWGESLPCVEGVAFEASKERQESDVTETSETPPSAALFAGEESPLCNWRCIRLPFIVRSLACGDEHFAVLSSNGALFTCGKNDCGQLGLGDTRDRKLLTKVANVCDLGKFSNVTCSAVGTLALSFSGEVYSFGWGQLGGVGHGSTKNALLPTKVCKDCKSISSGFQHSGAVSKDGEVYTFGWGKRGQCGHSMSTVIRLSSNSGASSRGGGSIRRRSSSVMRSTRINLEDVLVPTIVQTLSSLSLCITQVSCGFEMTAVRTDSGHIYVFGQGLDGQLGLGEDITQTIEPLQVCFQEVEDGASDCGASVAGEVTNDNDRNPNEAIASTRKQYFISEISCGNDTTIAVATDGSIFQWGLLEGSEISFYPLRIVFDFGPQSCMGLAEQESHGDRYGTFVKDGSDCHNLDGDDDDDDYYCDRDEAALQDTGGRIINEISNISCGGIFAIALSSTGELFSWDATGGESESNVVERHSRFFGWLDAPPAMHGMMSLIGAGDKYLVAAAAGAVAFQSQVKIDRDLLRQGEGKQSRGHEGDATLVEAPMTVESSLRLQLWLRDANGRPVLDPEDHIRLFISGRASISRTFSVKDVLAPTSEKYSIHTAGHTGNRRCAFVISLSLNVLVCKLLLSHPNTHQPQFVGIIHHHSRHEDRSDTIRLSLRAHRSDRCVRACVETTLAGHFSCEVWVNGEKIPEALNFKISAGQICISKSVVSEPELHIVAGQQASVALKACDRFGNPVSCPKKLRELSSILKLPIWRRVESSHGHGQDQNDLKQLRNSKQVWEGQGRPKALHTNATRYATVEVPVTISIGEGNNIVGRFCLSKIGIYRVAFRTRIPGAGRAGELLGKGAGKPGSRNGRDESTDSTNLATLHVIESAPDPSLCSITINKAKNWIAGVPSVAKLTIRDKFGNPCSSRDWSSKVAIELSNLEHPATGSSLRRPRTAPARALMEEESMKEAHSETIQSLVPPATVTIVDPQSATYLAKIIPTASGTYSLRARLGDNQIGVGSDFIRVAETNAVSFSPRSQSASASRKKRQRCRSRSTSSSLGAGRPVPPSPPQQVRKHESRSSSTSNPRRKAVASKARTYERLRVSEKNPRSATSAKKSKKIDARRSERASGRPKHQSRANTAWAFTGRDAMRVASASQGGRAKACSRASNRFRAPRHAPSPVAVPTFNPKPQKATMKSRPLAAFRRRRHIAGSRARSKAAAGLSNSQASMNTAKVMSSGIRMRSRDSSKVEKATKSKPVRVAKALLPPPSPLAPSKLKVFTLQL